MKSNRIYGTEGKSATRKLRSKPKTTLYNEKIDKRVGIGRIYAHYESTNGSSGSYGLGVPDWLKQPKAGDTTDSFKWYVLATIFAMGAGGLVLIGRRKGKKKDDEA